MPKSNGVTLRHTLPEWLRQAASIAVILCIVLVVWSVAATLVNSPPDDPEPGWLPANWWNDRPTLPSPPQVAVATWNGLFAYPINSPRSLIFHAGVTLEAALAGFALAAVIGVALATAIVHSRLLDRGLLPWVIVSQSIPVLATAPMIVVVLGNAGFTGLLPKAVISASLAFFPVTIGMCKGLRAAGSAQLELLHTYNASGSQIFRKLRWPAAIPYLFPALKVAMALAITGAIVGELPTGAQAGLGARLLIASYNGLMLLMWATLVVASLTAGLSVGVLTLIERALPRFRASQCSWPWASSRDWRVSRRW
jgi:NitT/TauT family transport system permease protein